MYIKDDGRAKGFEANYHSPTKYCNMQMKQNEAAIRRLRDVGRSNCLQRYRTNEKPAEKTAKIFGIILSSLDDGRFLIADVLFSVLSL